MKWSTNTSVMKIFFKRHKYTFPKASNIKYFQTLITSMTRFHVQLIYPYNNVKKMCPKYVLMLHCWGTDWEIGDQRLLKEGSESRKEGLFEMGGQVPSANYHHISNLLFLTLNWLQKFLFTVFSSKILKFWFLK